MSDTTGTTYTTLAERLNGGDLLALLAGLTFDAREDMTYDNGLQLITVVSAVAGVTHVKAQHTTGSPAVLALGQALGVAVPYPDRMEVIVDTHTSNADALECHGDVVANIRATMASADLDRTMFEAQQSIDRDGGIV